MDLQRPRAPACDRSKPRMCCTRVMHEDRIAGRYTLIERHGIGGMATVWRAKDERTGEIVAIKRLHPYVVADAAARARLEREAAAMRTIHHPSIVRPRELIEEADGPSLVMDFVAGRPLTERIADGPLPPDEAAAIASVVADALSVAHDHGIVHRDIKPANILIGDDGSVHLVDFGIAALMDAPPDGLTAATTMVGTLRYAAPERLAGGDVSARSDVWALGAVLYEMLTAKPAVINDDPAGALAASRSAPLDLDVLPPILGSIVVKAMAPEPADRYADAAALRDALAAREHWVDPDGVTAVVALSGSGRTDSASEAPPGAAASYRAGLPRPDDSRRRNGLILGGLLSALVLAAAAGAHWGGPGGTGVGAAAVGASANASSAHQTASPTRVTTSGPPTLVVKVRTHNDNGKHGGD
jgi:serine/threonine protein kinase